MQNAYTVGKNIYLRHPTQEDAMGSWYEWFSDEDTTRYLDARYWPNSLESQAEFYDSLNSDKSKLVLSIIETTNNRHIGVVSLSSINWVHRHADIGIVIGNKDFTRGVYAAETYALILRIAFKRLNLKNVRAGYCRSNKASEALLTLYKFKVAGIYENMMTIDGKEEDVVLTYLDCESWRKRNK